MTAWPALASSVPPLVSTPSGPFSTNVNSSNSGVWPGSSHPCGLRMWATLTAEVFELTRPMYSSMSLGLLPAAWIRVGWGMSVGMSLGFRDTGHKEYNKSFYRRDRDGDTECAEQCRMIASNVSMRLFLPPSAKRR